MGHLYMWIAQPVRQSLVLHSSFGHQLPIPFPLSVRKDTDADAVDVDVDVDVNVISDVGSLRFLL